MRTRLLIAYLAVVIIGIGLLSSTIPVQAYWDSPPPTFSTGPQGTAHQYEYANLNYTITAPRFVGLDSINVTSFAVEPDWETSAIELLNDVGNSVSMGPGDSKIFTGSIYVPGDVANGTHNITVICAWQEYYTNATFGMPENTSFIDQINIASRPALQLDATGIPVDGTKPFSVQFNSGASGGTPGYTYLWKFGDGSTDTSANPIHDYISDGSYDINLTVYDTLNRMVQTNFSMTVYPPLHIIASSNTTSGVAPLIVVFSCTASGGSAPYSYQWTFGDGTASNSAHPSHQYAQSGNYSVSLTVTDTQSQKKTYHINVAVIEAQTYRDSGTDDSSGGSNNNGTNESSGAGGLPGGDNDNGGNVGGSYNNVLNNPIIYLSVLLIGLLVLVSLTLVFRRRASKKKANPSLMPRSRPPVT